MELRSAGQPKDEKPQWFQMSKTWQGLRETQRLRPPMCKGQRFDATVTVCTLDLLGHPLPLVPVWLNSDTGCLHAPTDPKSASLRPSKDAANRTKAGRPR